MSSESEETAYSPPALDREKADALLRASPSEDLSNIYMDLSADQPKTDEARKRFRQAIQESFNLRLTDAVKRIWQLRVVHPGRN
jgi:hypothetical protein